MNDDVTPLPGLLAAGHLTDGVPAVAVVIPCYKVRDRVLDVIARVPPSVARIYCIDDACPEGTGRHVAQRATDARLRVLYHDRNLGVGGAVKTGYAAAIADGCTVAVKIDGDGQMDPQLVALFVAPILDGKADYTKGNRFFSPDDARGMPVIRLFGNAILSFFAKISTGYWNLMDPTNGYTALHLGLIDLLHLDKVSDRYFFETDLLFRLNIARCVVKDIPMRAVYDGAPSNLSVRRVFWSFLAGHLRNIGKRIVYNYYLRDFQVASIEFVLGPILVLSGTIYGLYRWWLSYATGVPATAGTVMLAALQIILGAQSLLSALSFDVRNVPTDPIHPLYARQNGTGGGEAI
jgi:glycosyltransferase involved in cell wall biosynthesis